MKNTNYIAPFFIFFIFQFSSLNAQILPEVGPNNVDETVELIFDMHGSQIEISEDELTDFLNSFLPPSEVDVAVTPPDAEVEEVTSTSISFEWQGVPNGSSSKAAYLRLDDLSLITDEETTSSNEVEFQVDDGLILFVFQTVSNRRTVGTLKVIIIDKPVFFNEADSEECVCFLPEPIAEPQEFGGISNSVDGNVFFEYEHTGNIGYYEVTISYTNVDVVSKFIVKITEGIGVIEVGVVCAENISYDSGGSVFYSVVEGIGPGSSLGSITFGSGINFDPATGSTGIILASLCEENEEQGGNGGGNIYGGTQNVITNNSSFKNELQLYPNPAYNNLNVKILDVSDESSSYTWIVVDAMGREVLSHKSTESEVNDDFDLNITKLPAGTYSVLLRNKNKLLKKRFVKIE